MREHPDVPLKPQLNNEPPDVDFVVRFGDATKDDEDTRDTPPSESFEQAHGVLLVLQRADSADLKQHLLEVDSDLSAE